jgi:hypothetical protein
MERGLLGWNILGASKIKLKKVNRKRTVTVRRVIIFLNISRHPLLICLHCCLHEYKTLKAVATATAAIVVLTPEKSIFDSGRRGNSVHTMVHIIVSLHKQAPHIYIRHKVYSPSVLNIFARESLSVQVCYKVLDVFMWMSLM